MAKTTYIDLPAGTEDLYFGALKSSDRFVFSRVVRKDTLLSVKRKAGISARSLLPQIAALWAVLSDEVKTSWVAAADEMDLSGWQLFVQDQTIRVLNGMPGSATPSTLHQSWVGNLKITAPADEIKIIQMHPREYWVSQKVIGKKGMFEPVLVPEDFSLPFKIGLNYKSNLTSTGAGSFAKFYALVWYRYQGLNLSHELSVPLDFSSDWKHAEATLSAIQSSVVGYDLYFHLKNLRGDLFFDNIEAVHSSQNWARDPFCKSVPLTFTRAFFQVPKNWAAVTLPDGAEYDTIYPDS